jgi:hypothetical protein
MRRPFPAGVPAAAALLLLTACGGSSDTDAAPASSTATADVDGFCADAQAVFSDANSAFDSISDPTDLPALLQQTTSELQSVDAPADIADSWAGFAAAIGQLSQTARTLDLSTPAGQGQFTQQYDAVLADTAAAQQDVDSYVTTHCPAAAGSPSS